MTTLVLDVDNKQKRALKGILKYLKINYREFQTNKDDYSETTKEEIFASIKKGLKEVKLAQEGKIKLKSFDQLLNEL